MTDNNLACTERYEQITPTDLPLACPPRHLRVWDAHPRVYLPIEEKGKALCPYCGTLYVLMPYPLPEQE